MDDVRRVAIYAPPSAKLPTRRQFKVKSLPSNTASRPMAVVSNPRCVSSTRATAAPSCNVRLWNACGI